MDTPVRYKHIRVSIDNITLEIIADETCCPTVVFSAPSPATTDLSISDFAHPLTKLSRIQRFTAIAYYLLVYKAKSSCTLAEFRAAYTESGWGISKFCAEEVWWAVQRGLMVRQGYNQYSITENGKASVGRWLSGENPRTWHS